MTPIRFDHITMMSSTTVDDNQRDDVAHEVHAAKGIEGLLTLWSYQDYYEPNAMLYSGSTPATDWWVRKSNPYAMLVREHLSSLNESEALGLLGEVTFPPNINYALWSNNDKAETKLLSSEARDKYSNASATTVRKLAQTFFPQFPALDQPNCALYLNTFESAEYNDRIEIFPTYFEPLEAFSDDAAALQYLLRVHQGVYVKRELATPGMLELLLSTDEQWAMYESMAMTPEESYAVASGQAIHAPGLALPSEFDI